jgi:hypothetical protein
MHPTTVVFESTQPQDSQRPAYSHFDSDSFLIGVDNHSTTTISNDKSHFIGPIRPTNVGIKGFGGTCVRAKGIGTVKWKIEDDEGKVHTFTIQNALYVPDSSLCILCPQQWAKQANDNFPMRNGTRCIDNADTCELEWKQRKYRRTIPWDPATNTGRFYSAPGTHHYRLYAAMLDSTTDMEQFEHVAF